MDRFCLCQQLNFIRQALAYDTDAVILRSYRCRRTQLIYSKDISYFGSTLACWGEQNLQTPFEFSIQHKCFTDISRVLKECKMDKWGQVKTEYKIRIPRK